MSEWRWGTVLVLTAAVVGGAWWYLHREPLPPPTLESVPETAPAAPPPPAAEVDHPVPPPPADAPPLPALDDSDAAFRTALLGLADALGDWLAPELLVRRLVATLDNLGREQATPRLWPVHPVGGEFRVTAIAAERWTVDAANAARYDAAVGLFVGLDAKALVALYLRWYPRLQKAYEELGFPGRSFNNRVIAVLDLLLATPEPAAPPELLRPKVYYQYADAALEMRPAGQKLLLRLGPAQRAAVKAQLEAIRAALLAATPPSRPAAG